MIWLLTICTTAGGILAIVALYDHLFAGYDAHGEPLEDDR